MYRVACPVSALHPTGTCDPLTPDVGVFKRCADFRAQVVRYCQHLQPCSPQQFVDTYHSRKKASYQLALLKLQGCTVTTKHAKVKWFLKMEKHQMGKKKVVPRSICPRSKEYNISIGVFLKKNEKSFMKAIDRCFGSDTVLSGYDSFTVGHKISKKWFSYKNPVAIGVDASRFDQHVSVQALQWEHSIYNGVFMSDELARLLRMQLNNDCIGFVEDKVLKFKVRGHRMSGDINTSMGNKLIMCGMMYTYFQELGVKADLCNNGDDCVIICEREDERKFDNLKSWYEKFGFNMTIEAPVYDLEKLEFCQSNPCCVNGKWRMIRKNSSIAKDSYSMQSMQTEGDYTSYLSAVGQCGMILNTGVPVLSSYHRMLYRCSGFKKISEGYMRMVIEYGNDERLGTSRVYRYEPITAPTRLSYFKSSGIDPYTQMVIENYFDNLELNLTNKLVMRPTSHLDHQLLNC